MRHYGNLLLVLALVLSPLTPFTARAQTMELSDAIHGRVVQLSKEGDQRAEGGHYRAAVEKYIEAFELLPEPKTDWEACTWLLTAIGDANFKSRNYEHAQAALTDAMGCPGAIGNPFIHLRLGQSQFELGDLQRANEELTRAYMGAGKDIFAEEDPKYFSHLKTVLRPPASGEW
jgi:tetratricopeptide (TPR) repeat protein